MKIVCSWCRYEGKPEVVGEKAPLDDGRETHGICIVHRDQVRAHWWASLSMRPAGAGGSKVASSSALFRWVSLLSTSKKFS